MANAMRASSGRDDNEHQGTDDEIEGHFLRRPPILQRPLFDQNDRIGADRRNLAAPIAVPHEISRQADVGYRAADLFENFRYARDRRQRKCDHYEVDLLFTARCEQVALRAANSNPFLLRRNARKGDHHTGPPLYRRVGSLRRRSDEFAAKLTRANHGHPAG